MIKGIGASKGIAIAKVYKLEMPDLTIVKRNVENTEEEISRLDNAIVGVTKSLEKIKEVASKNLSAENAAVIDAHMLVVNDPEMKDQIIATITGEKINAEAALDQVTSMFISIFENMDDEYMRERAADIRDVTTRLKANLLGKELPDLTLINEEVVIIAEDLTPSDTSQLDKKLVKGFATNIGGRTSHSAILARSMEIPAVVAMKDITERANAGDIVIIDGEQGIIIINPSVEQKEEYLAKQKAFLEEKELLKQLKDKPTLTTDGRHVELSANIGSYTDLESLLANGAEGVGLYRTEFLYMEGAGLPDEDTQYVAYKKVLEGLNGKPVIIRTLDIGGDKQMDAIKMTPEMNPFLGVRAIRLCFDREDIFRVQLRALLRASVAGNLHIMFPMIATLDEFRKARGLLEEEKANLISEGHKISDDIKVGIMIEIPAAAVIADQFAKEVDFFSVGTNDLIQYTFAADRMSEKVAYLYQPYNPSILRLLKMVIDASHKEGKWTGMCGEMAGEIMAAPLLLGLGLDEFSMSASSILEVRKLMGEMSFAEAKELANKAINMQTSDEVIELVNNFLKK